MHEKLSLGVGFKRLRMATVMCERKWTIRLILMFFTDDGREHTEETRLCLNTQVYVV